MPKKFSRENAKSVTAREKNKVINAEKEKQKQQEHEDSLWIEDDRKIIRKMQKKQIDVKKKEEIYNKKLEAKALLERELAELTSKNLNVGNTKVSKLTKVQISKNTGQNKARANETHLNMRLEENVNRIKSDEHVARSVDEAISVLIPIEKIKDKHPEKRMKAGYNAFEERRLKELQAENSTLKLSQMKQLIFKEWKKSPQNPLNINN